MSQCFRKPYEPFGEDIIIKVDLCDCTTKTNLRKATGIDTSNLFLMI